jgi:predicted permease
MIETWSYADYLDVRDAAGGMTITGWSRGDGLFRLPDRAGTLSLPTMYVSSNYFSTVGLALARGPGFSPVDDASRAEPEAIISHRLWQARLGSDPNIIGRAITVNQSEYVVVGVTPEKFRGHLGGDNGNAQLWLPLTRHPRLSAIENARFNRDADWVRVVARLSPGTTLGHADAAVQSVMGALAARYTASNRDKVGGVEPYFPPGAQLRAQVSRARMVVFALAGMVLLVVCLNISGMMLVRGAMRERELAVRLAIGASRWRLVKYHLTEALVLAVLGGMVASALLFGGPVVVAWAYDFYGPELDLFKPDVWLVLQCIALCFVASVVLGLLPALRFSRPAILAALKNDSAGSGRRVGRLQRLTAALQAGIAVPFLVIGGVKLDEARVTATADLGFAPQGLYAARVNLSDIGKTEDDRQLFVRAVQENLARAQGIVSVSIGDGVPLDFIYRDTRVAREGESGFVAAHTTRVGVGYFETLGIRLLAGRPIDANDGAGAERVVLLSEPLARRLFPAGDPIGKRVVFALEGDERQAYTVVGVTGDLVSTQMGNPRPQLFISLAQHPASTILAIARGTAADPSVQRAFENAISNANPDFVIGNGSEEIQSRPLITGEGLVDNSHRDLLTHSAVGGVLAGVALILAALGVYGVIAFMVATRTREIGVRVALGASRSRVLGDVLGDALKLVVPGIGVGLVAAVLWVRVAEPSWYPLGGVEPLIYVVAAATAFFVAVLAGLPSARRAAAVQPIVAIRTD